jgi:tetratricopeptide (TPR) repeat protein
VREVRGAVAGVQAGQPLRCTSAARLDSSGGVVYNPQRVGQMQNGLLGEVTGFRVGKRYRAVALAVWPGLAQIWLGQEALGLLVGVCFASTLNLAIVSRWIWREVFAAGWSDFFLIVALAWWVASLAYTLWWIAICHPDRHRAEIDRLYREAQEAYLQGRWRDSRGRLERILAWDETDADALMQLATLYQRTDQPDLARHALQQCLQLREGEKWRWEIQQALARLGGK